MNKRFHELTQNSKYIVLSKPSKTKVLTVHTKRKFDYVKIFALKIYALLSTANCFVLTVKIFNFPSLEMGLLSIGPVVKLDVYLKCNIPFCIIPN